MSRSDDSAPKTDQANPEDSTKDSLVLFALGQAREDTRHAENVTQSRMYNFLCCNSILVLSWATVFVASPQPAQAGRPYVLIALATLSLLLGILYARFGSGAAKFIQMHYDLSLILEAKLPKALWTATPIVALQHGTAYECKSDYQQGKIIPGQHQGIHTGHMLVAVPILFAILSAVLFVSSVYVLTAVPHNFIGVFSG
jgi:hypothetical protein